MSKKFFGVLAVALVLALSSTASAGLVNYWSFNGDMLDTAGTFAGNTSTNATDMQADAWYPPFNPLKYVTGPVSGTQALQTQGFGTLSTSAKTLDSLNGTYDTKLQANSTLAFWANVAAYSQGANWVAAGPCDGNQGEHLMFHFQTGPPDIVEPNLSYPGDTATISAPISFTNAWHFVTVTFDDPADTYTLYVDGVSKATGVYLEHGTPTAKWISLAPYNSSAYIGTVGYARMSMWDNTLSASDVAALYANGGAPVTSAPVAEPAGLGLIGVALLALRKRRS